MSAWPEIAINFSMSARRAGSTGGAFRAAAAAWPSVCAVAS
jgi:hypothetical protein